ncbi:MAG: hypothetical protein ACI4SV_00025 [Duodenibacillus sp.]
MLNNQYNKTEYLAEQSRLASCLNRLRSPEFAPFTRFLKSVIADRSETLVNAEDDRVIYRMQGQIKAVKDILETIEADRKVGA